MASVEWHPRFDSSASTSVGVSGPGEDHVSAVCGGPTATMYPPSLYRT